MSKDLTVPPPEALALEHGDLMQRKHVETVLDFTDYLAFLAGRPGAETLMSFGAFRETKARVRAARKARERDDLRCGGFETDPPRLGRPFATQLPIMECDYGAAEWLIDPKTPDDIQCKPCGQGFKRIGDAWQAKPAVIANGCCALHRENNPLCPEC